jgi:hypothetical protein
MSNQFCGIDRDKIGGHDLGRVGQELSTN